MHFKTIKSRYWILHGGYGGMFCFYTSDPKWSDDESLKKHLCELAFRDSCPTEEEFDWEFRASILEEVFFDEF